MTSTGKSKNVIVAVRVKPENRAVRKCLTIHKNQINVGEKVFYYDHVFNEDSTQSEVYSHCVSRLVDSCFKGYNATIFAYGQTGSGKTHSIIGLARDPEDEGVIPRALRHVYRTLDTAAESSHTSLVSLHVSFIEIYNEDCRDLLHVDIPSRDIMIREDKDGRIFFTGAREEAVSSVDAALQYLEMGNLQRTTGGTFMNASSSRSHAIFTLSLELFEYQASFHTEGKDSEDEAPPASAGRYIQSKLHLVDLAGSERAKRTGAEGVRLKESVGINQGLLALGKVIRALTVNANETGGGGPGVHKQQHVPYRESKLTRFLQDSLGGNSFTVMLACVSAADANTHETLSTLAYASRARAVQNKVRANVKVAPLLTAPASATVDAASAGDVENAVVSALRIQLAQMQQQMIVMRQEKGNLESGRPAPRGIAENAKLRASLNNLYDSIDAGSFRTVGTAAQRPELAALNTGVEVSAEDKETVAQILPVLKDVQQGLEGSLEELGETITSDRHYANGTFWALICAATASSETLAEIIEHARGLSAEAMRLSLTLGGVEGAATSPRALAKSAGYADLQQQEIAQLRQDLQGCYDDLKKDEEIFQEKMKELKRSRKTIKALETDKRALEEETQVQYQQIQKLLYDASAPKAAAVAVMPDSANRAESKADGDAKLSTFQAKADPIDYTMYLDPEDVDKEELALQQDDVEMSRVIAALVPEPDLAQLMEDLENIQGERDALLVANEEVQTRYRTVAEEATAQRTEYEAKQVALKRKLQELEVGIRLKQSCISDLVRAESEATAAAEQNGAQLRALEQETASLQAQLRTLKAGNAKDKEEAASERAKRHELERRAAEAEEELDMLRIETRRQEKRMVQDRAATEKKKEDIKQAEQLAEDLLQLRNEYARVTSQLDNNESTHRKALDRLTSQVAAHRKQHEDSASQIKKLEVRNAELSARLERNAKAAKERPPPVPGSAVRPPPPGPAGVAFGSGTGRTAEAKLEGASMYSSPGRDHAHASHSSVGSAGKGGRHKGSAASQLTPASGGASVSSASTGTGTGTGTGIGTGIGSGSRSRRVLTSEWVLRRVDELTSARTARMEVKKLSARCADLDKERQATRAEVEHLKRAAQEHSAPHKRDKYLAQLGELDSRLSRLKTISAQKVHGSKQHRESELVISQLQQARANVQSKISSTLQDPSQQEESAKLHDLLDELETLDAEFDLNRVRLDDERRKLSKGAKLTDGANSGQAEASLLAQEIGAKFDVNEAQMQVLVSLAGSLVDSRHRSAADAAEILELQCRLDEKESELEEITDSASKARSVYVMKAEQVRREAEDKQNFLLQQLRVAEARTLETSSILRKSQSREATGIGGMAALPASLLNLHRDSIARESLMSADSFSAGGGTRRSSDSTNNTNTSITSEEEKYKSERQRREQLERRNSELVKELKTLRTSKQRA